MFSVGALLYCKSLLRLLTVGEFLYTVAACHLRKLSTCLIPPSLDW
jgi:hypothetical protein